MLCHGLNDACVNIQSKPTPVLFVKGGEMELFFTFNARQSFSLASSVLRLAIIPVGTYPNDAELSFGLASSLLLESGDIFVGSFPFDAEQDFSLVSSLLKVIVIDTGTYQQPATQSFSLASSILEDRSRDCGTYPMPATQSFGLVSSALV